MAAGNPTRSRSSRALRGARRAARRPGLDDHRLALRRLRTRVGVELIRRAVTMVRRCAARATAEALRKEDAAADEMTAALR